MQGEKITTLSSLKSLTFISKVEAMRMIQVFRMSYSKLLVPLYKIFYAFAPDKVRSYKFFTLP